MRILITGASGQLGVALKCHAPKLLNGEEVNLLTPTRKELDLSSEESCSNYIYKFKPEFIFNAGAFTGVDDAENKSDIAYKVNANAPRIIAKALKDIGGKLIHFSTDYVFSGDQGKPYKPFDKKFPLGVYGKSKAIGEDNIQEFLLQNKQSIILRTSWLMGPVGKNFALTMLKLLAKKKSLKVVSDQISAPTSTKSLSCIAWTLMEQLTEGKSFPAIMHWSDAGVASWYDVAIAISEIAQELNLIKKPAEIFPVDSSQYNSVAKRPNYSLLDTTDTSSELGCFPLHWKNELKNSLKQILANPDRFR